MKKFGTPVKTLSTKETIVPEKDRWKISDETWREIEAIDMNRKLATHAKILFD